MIVKRPSDLDSWCRCYTEQCSADWYRTQRGGLPTATIQSDVAVAEVARDNSKIDFCYPEHLEMNESALKFLVQLMLLRRIKLMKMKSNLFSGPIQ